MAASSSQVAFNGNLKPFTTPLSAATVFQGTMTVVSKTEINLRRLLAAAPHQENQAKLVHYVATLRELLEQLTEEKTPEGLPRLSKAKVNESSEKIQAVATKLAIPVVSGHSSCS